MSDLLSQLQRLVRRANRRVRAQRALDAACGALLPALVLAAIAILLTKHGVLAEGELFTVLGALGAIVALVCAGAALWPIDTLGTLVELDASNAFSDRLSSAWAFAQLPAGERTAEMALHLERTRRALSKVETAKAHRFRRPPELVPAAVMALVVAFVALLDEPDWAPLSPSAAAATEAPRFILDLAALRPEIRQIERLTELAEESGDPAVQALADELESLLDRAESGVLTEQELLDELARLEEQIASLETEPPASMRDDWTEVAETLREVLAEAEIPDELADDVEVFLDALEEGDEQALADAMDTLRELLENEALDPEDLAALADALSALADAFDPSDFDLRQELDALRDQIAELEDQLGEGGGRRTQRALDQAREALADAEQRLAEGQEGLGEGGEMRQDLADSLREAADALREPPGEASETETETGENEVAEGEPVDREGEAGPESPAERESADGEERVDERGSETAEQSPDGEGPRSGEPSEGQPSDGEHESSADSGDREGQPRQPGAEQAASEPGEGQPRDTPPGEAGETEPGQAGQSRDSSQPQTPQERAAEQLEQAADQIRDRQRQEARAEARERAEQATEGLRENLQRNDAEPDSGEPQDELAEQNWDDFMDRAEGNPSGRPRGEPQGPSESGDNPQENASGESQTDSESGGGSAEQAGGEAGEPGEDHNGEQGGEGFGDVEGGEALGENGTNLDSERERVEAEVEVTEDGEAGPPTTGEVLESAAVEGFASRGYQEVYQEYATAVEEALRSQSIPPGYARFIERYFGLIEPRR